MAGKNNTPARISYKRKKRLLAAAKWIRNYTGKNIIKGYTKHFGVDKLCAIKELEFLGVVISEERKKQVIDAHNSMIEQRQKKKETIELDLNDCDENFAFIAGYTSGGAAYGITWEMDDSFIGIDDQDDALPW